jgi:zinc transport system permease protein
MISALLTYQFLQNAVAAGLLASIVCGIIGVIIIEKKMVMLSGGIAHTSYGGVGLGYLLGFEPILGAFLFAVFGALAIGQISRRKAAKTDVIIGLFWSFGMALGVLFIAMTPGYPPDMNSYLFGNILSVTHSDILLMVVLTFVVVIAVASFYDTWKAFLFDEEFAAVMGIPTARLNNILLILVAMTVVVLIRVVGIILVLALLTAPAAVAGLLTNSFGKRILYSIIFGAVFCLAGLWLSYTWNIASGASIVIFSTLCYLLVYVLCGRKGTQSIMKTVFRS